MSRLTAPAPAELTADVQSSLDQVQAQFGFVPNMFATLAASPGVLDFVMTAQAKGNRLLDAKTRHTIALAVSDADGCDYCLAIHTAGSLQGGMTPEDIDLSKAGGSVDPKRAAAARLAREVIATRGHISDAGLADIRSAGYADAQILAIVTLAVRALLTNYLNNLNQTIIDIPVPAVEAG
ncbi:putative peroxidase-related enzyme [Nocardioides sp. BE266]|uniref:carboxymuconolactone decarboxylase family protein n=1 Tax=Nocardioides sp. BE266 TaxID=2817725 RepID=UPI00285BE4AF|nr:carboxymuconolactone decarboxylase family protein [Nocardioides sp. BE266]MDR7255057.1 putative peroxidase-related enzyme [Nocardioides sp. BE266]